MTAAIEAIDEAASAEFAAEAALLGGWDRTADAPAGGAMVVPSRLLVWRRLVLYGLLTLGLLPVQVAALLLRARLARTLPVFYNGLCARLLGFRVKVRGKPVSAGPALFVSNHASYFDIVVLGSLLEASFVAKSEVAGWPVFGTLARLNRTVFVERRRHRAKQQADAISRRLGAAERLILFPEGTSNDGNRTLPFKSSLFAAVLSPEPAAREAGSGMWVQPVSVTYTRLNGMPMGRGLRPFYAWYGDMDLVPHLLEALALGTVEVAVEFHAPVAPEDFVDRKALAEHCERIVADGVSRALAGR